MYYMIDNEIYEIRKFEEETDDIYIKRVKWIQEYKKKESVKERIELSKYIYMKLMYKCEYDDNFNNF